MIKPIFNKMVKLYLTKRYKRIERIYNQPNILQKNQLATILKIGAQSEYGEKLKFQSIKTETEYKKSVPLIRYEDISKHITMMMDGKSNVLIPKKSEYFAKSSGTTGQRSKYIPMPWRYHRYNHFAASWDTMSMVYHEDPSCKIFEKKSTIMGGAIAEKGEVKIGDVSAILVDKMHWAGRPFFTPSFEVAKMANWEEKIDKMAQVCKDEPVVMIGGVPTWTLVLCNKILELTGKQNMHEVWPTAKYYMHGGVGFEPYREQFQKLFPSSGFKYYEVYNASEGYFAVQDRSDADGMMLMVDHDIYYEFLPLGEIENRKAKTYNLEEIQLNVPYAMVISTTNGLYRYIIGDTVEFVSRFPYRIKLVGRTQQYINMFGEELMISNTETALAKACKKHKAIIKEYTIGPKAMSAGTSGKHIWVVEFEKSPKSLTTFTEDLDLCLRECNSDYDAKRVGDIVLNSLEINVVASNTFYSWMKAKGKYGGQHKVPRLSTDLTIVNELLAI